MINLRRFCTKFFGFVLWTQYHQHSIQDFWVLQNTSSDCMIFLFSFLLNVFGYPMCILTLLSPAPLLFCWAPSLMKNYGELRSLHSIVMLELVVNNSIAQRFGFVCFLCRPVQLSRAFSIIQERELLEMWDPQSCPIISEGELRQVSCCRPKIQFVNPLILCTI